MVVFDTSVLAIAFDENASVPIDPSTGAPLERCRERMDYLLKTIAANKARILLPTPVISEFMVHGGPDREKRLNLINSSRAFTIAPFDLRAAIECSLIETVTSKSKVISDFNQETKAKVKFDRQILATAISRKANTIYTGDKQLASKAKQCGLAAVLTWELELPPEKPKSPQFEITFSPPTPEAL